MVRVVLSKQGKVNDQIELEIDVYDTPTAHKWTKLLKRTLQSNTPIKKHVSHHGWIMDQSRTLKDIVDELHMRVDAINNFNFAKKAWELKDNRIKIDFNVELDLTVANLIQGKSFNIDVVNQLHDKFVQLEGAKEIDNTVSVSPYFDIAPPDIRWHISKLNNLAHELFHWGQEYKRWHRAKWYNPEIHVQYYTDLYEPYSKEDDESFNLRYEFGKVFVADGTVGKLYWDAFNDQDDHVHNDELFAPTHIIPDFQIYLGSTNTVENRKMKETQYWKWLYDRGLRGHEPALTRVGKPWIGEINLKPFGSQNQMRVIEKLNGYNNIHAIIFDEYKSTYEWTMSEEEIDIQQHA